jgi:hypothetical protein
MNKQTTKTGSEVTQPDPPTRGDVARAKAMAFLHTFALDALLADPHRCRSAIEFVVVLALALIAFIAKLGSGQ